MLTRNSFPKHKQFTENDTWNKTQLNLESFWETGSFRTYSYNREKKSFVLKFKQKYICNMLIDLFKRREEKNQQKKKF